MIKTISLSGNFRDVKQADEFFKLAPELGFSRFVLMAPDWNRGPANPFLRGQIADGSIRNFKSYICGEKTVPALASYVNKNEIETQREIADAVYRNCLNNDIKFIFNLVLPKFVYNDKAAIAQILPGLFYPQGRMNLSAPEHIPLIISMMLEIYSRYPKMAGFEIWIAEGAGATVHHFEFDDLLLTGGWMEGWLDAVSQFGRQYNLEMAVFSHHYHHSRGTLWNSHTVIMNHPDLAVMIDNTWPEENPALSPLKYLDDSQFEEIFKRNPVILNYLLDTEYCGQGRIPSVYPQFLQECLLKAEQMNAACVNGRVFYWDDYGTMEGWNIINVYLFCALAKNPGGDAASVLKDIMSKKFSSLAAGSTAANAAANLLMESRQLTVAVQTLNGISFPDHSAFPQSSYFNKGYFKDPFLAMKAVDDLFSEPGTYLGNPADSELRAGAQWRTQLGLVSKEPSCYINDIETGIAGIGKLKEEVKKLKNDLSQKDFDFIYQSYDLWEYLAKANALFIAAAMHHAAWVKSGCPKQSGLKELSGFGEKIKIFAHDFDLKYPDRALFSLANRMTAMADFMANPDIVSV
ncbi:MAG: hypothetical protein FWD78_00610 [Treponema sp.]|nr:hypothetical protein [Treponema sp.]